ncbi:tetratricopeptide repeat protein [Gilliamella sp. Imp1-1]|uniref:tetratricopeptide repeat protein n=1 Tax=Gilliamella sp. Imp1-1 TaxID=3120248 RepID=UPI000461ABE3|nr:tetratricopeptide repeat protein [Gilliamella apicola]KDN11217.1 hypothetical protein GAPWKB30_0096 [Gilliamella apicola]OCG55556.1 hypothetical protein A9G38_01580 [Gilliamella apicola]
MQLGSKEAQNNLGRFYYIGIVVKKNYTKARKLYEQAAKQGNIYALHNLANMYYNGLGGLKKDFAKGVELDTQSAQSGNPEAQYSLGWLYYNGSWFEKNYTEARRWFQFAAEQNHADAQYNLGIIYHQGLGVAINTHTAKYYFQQACQNNHQEACKHVKKLL